MSKSIEELLQLPKEEGSKKRHLGPFGLSYKQFLFCEEWLRNGGNALAAYRVAYPNDSGNNSFQCFRNRQVQAYLRDRLKEKQVNLDTLYDKATNVMNDLMENATDENKLKAAELFLKFKEYDSKLKGKLTPVDSGEKNITINIETVDKGEKNES